MPKLRPPIHEPRPTDSEQVQKFAERIKNYIEGDYDTDYSYAVDIMEDMLEALRGEKEQKCLNEHASGLVCLKIKGHDNRHAGGGLSW